MPVSGAAGAGDQWGTSPEMGPRELEQTAAIVVNKQALAIVTDTIVMSFTKLHSGLWDYKASAGQPTLSHPLNSVRSSSPSKEEDTSWAKFYDQLIQNLPSEIAARLIREREKVREEKNPSYSALDQFLMTMAQGLSWIESASKPENPNSVALRNQALNLALPSILAEHLGDLGKTILDEGTNFLNSVGSNYAHHDKLSNNLDQAAKALSFMQGLNGKGK